MLIHLSYQGPTTVSLMGSPFTMDKYYEADCEPERSKVIQRLREVDQKFEERTLVIERLSDAEADKVRDHVTIFKF